MQTQGWREMRAFDGVDLEDSRVTGWRFELPPGRFVVSLDARVMPGPAQPPEDRAARLVFERATRVDGLCPPADFFRRTTDEPPGIDTLAHFRREDDGSYRFDATWGEIRVYCDSIRFEIDAAGRRTAA